MQLVTNPIVVVVVGRAAKMNNLLRTLTESHVEPHADLRILLTAVKEGRRQVADARLSDPFYDSLEGLLMDLKTVSIDNHDAEPFLKPVSKAEVPDYHLYISNPMDFQTMLKKVKAKQYKSKREFQDDLELIWTNCYTYNAEGTPIRDAATRLRIKAEGLLKHITDRRDRTDPAIPSDLPSSSTAGRARLKINGVNGHMNGHGSHMRSSSYGGSKPTTPTTAFFRNSAAQMPPKRLMGDIPFGELPALVRSQEGMRAFADLDRDMEIPQAKTQVVQRLREILPIDHDEDVDARESPTDVEMDGSSAGEKRKPNGATVSRPRKRARVTAQYPAPLPDEKDEFSQMWWGAVQSDALLANGLPNIPFGPSSSTPKKRKKVKASSNAEGKASKSRMTVKKESEDSPMPTAPFNPKALLHLMNNNIRTIRRVRHTHSKFLALNAATAPGEDDEGQPEAGPSFSGYGPSGSKPTSGYSGSAAYLVDAGLEDEMVDDKIDEAPWVFAKNVGKGKGKERHVSGIDIGEKNASDCLHWAGAKILEHTGFQGTSKGALDVFADVTAEYFQNVGRTIKYLTDKFGSTMTPEEIILHTLFESGSSKVSDLERFVSDDIERYGNRLGELEKKLVNAYRETTSGEGVEDEGLFEEEDDEEAGTLALGEFAEVLGEDYLGFRELGIAAELGLSALSVPKRLFKGRKGRDKPTTTKPTEPPPPYPPPAPFIPLTAAKIDDQIGLLKPYYTDRFRTLALSIPQPVAAPPPLPGRPGFAMPPLPGPLLPPTLPSPSLPPNTLPVAPASAAPPAAPSAPLTLATAPIPPDLILPDDQPLPSQVKMGPIGQIAKPSMSSATTKKKKPAPDGAALVPGLQTPGGGNAAASPEDSSTPKKKRATSTIGNGSAGGSARKKKDGQPGPGSGPGALLPLPVIASA